MEKGDTPYFSILVLAQTLSAKNMPITPKMVKVVFTVAPCMLL
jgi:hypothetical protein